MIQLYKMAWRDLGRNRRRTFFSMLALAFGVALLLFMASFIAGEMRGAMQTSIKLQSGHLQVWAASYNEDKTSLKWEDLIQNPDALAAQLAAQPEVLAATPRLYATGIVAAGNTSTGVRVIGIDPASIASAPFRDGMVSGDYLTADDRGGLLMGRTLADKLKLAPGDTINLLVNTSNGDVDQQVFAIRGIYSTDTPGYDESTIFLPLAKAQAITRAENHASVIFILLKDQDQTDAMAAALQGPAYQVKTYLELNALLNEFEQYANSMFYLFYLIVLGITATVIINTLIMSVFERTREIGILAAMGMRGRRIMAMFFAESSLLAVGGIAMGVVLGSLLSAYVQRYGFFIGDFGITGILIGERIYAYLTLDNIVTLTIMAFVITLLASLYPAWMAAHMEPVEALHGGK
ncbi:MAG: ABC transporter permease [Anaerolineales bacterium]|nr:MAG: ABC transporter permease [Anaerolineales bacterium]